MRNIMVGTGLMWLAMSAGASERPATQPTTQPEQAVDHDEQRLSYVNEIQLVDANTVYIKSNGMMIHRMTEDSVEFDDLHFIDGSTGEIKDEPHARKPDEITLKVVERCIVGGNNVGLDLKLLRIVHDRAVFQRDETRRT